MLEYLKMILWKVSFDRGLFEKELRKGIAQLDTEEVLLLEDWCHELFSERYHAVLQTIFCSEKCQGSSFQPAGAAKAYAGSRLNILGF